MQDQNLHLLKVVTADAGPWAATAARARQPAAPGDVAIPGTGRGWPATQGPHASTLDSAPAVKPPPPARTPASARAGETPRRQRVPQRHAGRSAGSQTTAPERPRVPPRRLPGAPARPWPLWAATGRVAGGNGGRRSGEPARPS